MTPRWVRALKSSCVAVVVALALTSFKVIADDSSISTSPTTAESVFADALRPAEKRLLSAREAAQRGDHEAAIHDYRLSISEDPETAESAIAEVVEVFQADAKAHKAAGRFIDESKQTNHCYSTLQQIKQADATSKVLPKPAREMLFKQMADVRSAGSARAKSHIDAADRLRHEAKGTHWWNDDNENTQAEALHEVNLAWCYYPSFADEPVVSAMYEIGADMKDELPGWQYSQVMERDRLNIGSVFGER